MTQREEFEAKLKLVDSSLNQTRDYPYDVETDDYDDYLINNIYHGFKMGVEHAKAQAVPEGFKVVPVEPTAEQFGGMARDVIQWMRFTESKNQHSESLVKWLKDMGNEIPAWLYSDPEINHLSKHVISKGTIAAIIYKAMLEDAPEQNK